MQEDRTNLFLKDPLPKPQEVYSNNPSHESLFGAIKFNHQGLIPVIAQDFNNGEVLMFAWMNRQALNLTIKTNYAHYFSRSRRKIWRKGEISQQTQEVKEILVDCDGDCLILKIDQQGVACHLGTRSCFSRTVLNKRQLKVNQQPIISHEELYGKKI